MLALAKTHSSMRALLRSSRKLVVFSCRIVIETVTFRYTSSYPVGDKATLESDLSTEPAAGIGAGVQFPPNLSDFSKPILARQR
jgi:hypothetical protein